METQTPVHNQMPASAPGAMLPAKGKSKGGLILIIVIIAVLLLGAGGFWVYKTFIDSSDSENEEQIEVKYIEVDASEAKKLIEENPDIKILDFSGEYSESHIPGAVNIRLSDLRENYDLLDKTDIILVYCHFKVASVEAAQGLTDNSFENVYRLKGEFDAWVDAGYEIEEGEGIYLKEDSDEDGLTDKEEIELGTDPYNEDTDGDGLEDFREVKINTDPLKEDTDGDGYTDGEEVEGGYDPLSKPEDEQEQVKVDEMIELVDSAIIGAEGTAIRYIKDGKYGLEIKAKLPYDENIEYYAWGMDNNDNMYEFGRLEKVSEAEAEPASTIDLQTALDEGMSEDDEEEEEMMFANYELKFESEEDMYGYFIINIGTKAEEEYTEILIGEFNPQESM